MQYTKGFIYIRAWSSYSSYVYLIDNCKNQQLLLPYIWVYIGHHSIVTIASLLFCHFTPQLIELLISTIDILTNLLLYRFLLRTFA